jgi:hypothetical protein
MPLATTPAPKVISDPNAPPDAKTHPKAKTKDRALRRSMINFQNAGSQARKQTNLLWKNATMCPLWKQKRIQKKDKETGKLLPLPIHPKTKRPLTTRGNRVLSSSTIKTMASGAASAVAAMLHEESQALRCDTVPEDKRYPILPSFGVGASMAAEAVFVAYTQEIFATAVAITLAVGKHKKVSKEAMTVAAGMVNSKIAAATGFVPPAISVRRVRQVGSTKKPKEDVDEEEAQANTEA